MEKFQISVIEKPSCFKNKPIPKSRVIVRIGAEEYSVDKEYLESIKHLGKDSRNNLLIAHQHTKLHQTINGYYIKFGDNKPGAANYVESREYESFGDASMAAGILSNMLMKSDSVDVQHFEFFVRAALYVTDSPNKW